MLIVSMQDSEIWSPTVSGTQNNGIRIGDWRKLHYDEILNFTVP